MATTTTNFGWDIPQSTDLVKDGATAIAALGQDIDTAFIDLKGGTTGQVLSKASNTDLDYTWVTDAGDISGVTAGTGISGGGTSGTVTITNSMATAIDAKGDLIAGTGADAFDRLAVGTNGQVLTADSTVATGLKWATASSTPTFVGISGVKSTSQSIANNTETAVTFDTEDFDTNGFHDNATNNSRITIPSGYAGKYLFTYMVTFVSNSTGIRYLGIRKNGTVVKYPAENSAIATDSTPLSFSVILNLAVGDYVDIVAYQNSGGSLNLTGAGANSYFQAQFLGA